jgi:AraC-like DNA-binding protein
VSAVSAAEDAAIGLDAVTDHAATAVLAGRRQGVNRALEAVERVGLIAANDLKRLVVLVAANIASGHRSLLALRPAHPRGRPSATLSSRIPGAQPGKRFGSSESPGSIIGPWLIGIIGGVSPPPLARHLLRARGLVDSRYAEPLDLVALARAAHVSPRHFSRSFRRTFGETPYQYLLTRRIERALHLLRTTDQRVAEVCLAMGFTSVDSFHHHLPPPCRRFAHGLSPE